MKKILTILLNSIVLFGFAAPTDTLPTLLPPRPPQNYQLAPHIRLMRNEQIMLTNLAIFIRFADDLEFTESLEPINQMFNDSTPYNISVYNYYHTMTYGKINYHTVYTNNIQNNIIVSYQDIKPRAYFQPQSETNPDGYPPQTMGITNPRETELLSRVMRYVDSLHLVDTNINLDGNDDGKIDNISFIIKGNVGGWYDNVDLDDLYDSGNGFFDFFEKPHTYWIFRPNSSIDTINGSVNLAAFGYGNRTAFGPATNPYPFLTDGTPETSFEITNIQYSGDQASFDVEFLHDGVPTYIRKTSYVYPNPTRNELNLSLDNISRVEIYDILGKIILSEEHPAAKINVSSLNQGAYFIKIYTDNVCYTEKFIKQ